MMRRFAQSLIFVAALAAAQPAFTQEPPSSTAFVERLYATYADDQPRLPDKQIYSKSLLRLMARDAKLAGGEVGYLNGDPLCDCQDYESFRADIGITEKLGGAEAKIDFSNFGREVHLTLVLIRENNAWRVDDVLTGDESLRKGLEKSIKDAKSRR